ncbi:hypothetical protein KAW08_06750 [bacterium]|nr:hypothetical protein [bacterium]
MKHTSLKEIHILGSASGVPEEIKREIISLHKTMNDSRHIFSSGNCLAEYVKPENVQAMSKAIVSLYPKRT